MQFKILTLALALSATPALSMAVGRPALPVRRDDVSTNGGYQDNNGFDGKGTSGYQDNSGFGKGGDDGRDGNGDGGDDGGKDNGENGDGGKDHGGNGENGDGGKDHGGNGENGDGGKDHGGNGDGGWGEGGNGDGGWGEGGRGEGGRGEGGKGEGGKGEGGKGEGGKGEGGRGEGGRGEGGRGEGGRGEGGKGEGGWGEGGKDGKHGLEEFDEDTDMIDLFDGYDFGNDHWSWKFGNKDICIAYPKDKKHGFKSAIVHPGFKCDFFIDESCNKAHGLGHKDKYSKFDVGIGSCKCAPVVKY